jgi:hypothetical protein
VATKLLFKANPENPKVLRGRKKQGLDTIVKKPTCADKFANRAKSSVVVGGFSNTVASKVPFCRSSTELIEAKINWKNVFRDQGDNWVTEQQRRVLRKLEVQEEGTIFAARCRPTNDWIRARYILIPPPSAALTLQPRHGSPRPFYSTWGNHLQGSGSGDYAFPHSFERVLRARAGVVLGDETEPVGYCVVVGG